MNDARVYLLSSTQNARSCGPLPDVRTASAWQAALACWQVPSHLQPSVILFCFARRQELLHHRMAEDSVVLGFKLSCCRGDLFPLHAKQSSSHEELLWPLAASPSSGSEPCNCSRLSSVASPDRPIANLAHLRLGADALLPLDLAGTSVRAGST